jgi:hypothetical protein
LFQANIAKLFPGIYLFTIYSQVPVTFNICR